MPPALLPGRITKPPRGEENCLPSRAFASNRFPVVENQGLDADFAFRTEMRHDVAGFCVRCLSDFIIIGQTRVLAQ